MKTAEKQITTRLNPRWCRPDDADKNYKLMEVLRPAVLGSSDSLGVHRSGAWSHSVRPGMPLPAAGARAHRCAPGSLPSRWPWTAASRQDRGPHHAAIQGQRPFFSFFWGGKKPYMSGQALTGLSQAVTRAGASMKRVLKLEKGKATRCAAAVEVYVRGMKSQLSKKAFQAMCSGSSRWPMTLA